MDPLVIARAQQLLESMPCPCGGHYDNQNIGSHYVWIAFLHYENDEFRQEQCGRDYSFIPVNRMACWLSSTDIYHCQMMFWNHGKRAFETVSVDAHRNVVHIYDQKKFRRGWTFYRLKVKKWQELAMYLFSKDQVGKPINRAGMDALPLTRIMPSWAVSGEEKSWFCAELCVATMKRANLFYAERPETMLPGNLRDLIESTHEADFFKCTHPVKFKDARREAGLDD